MKDRQKSVKQEYAEPKYKNMTIRQRLTISNILMISIPLAVTILCCAACVLITMAFNTRTQRLAAMNNEDVLEKCNAIIASFEQALSEPDPETALEQLEPELDRNGIRAVIMQDDQAVWSCGETSRRDDSLMNAADDVGENCYISSGNRQLVIRTLRAEEGSLRLYLILDKLERPYRGLVRLVIVTVLVFLIVLVISVWVSNRFLSEFVFSRIARPLHILSSGVREIADGNLNYEISYDVNDEFRPICEDFNAMSGQLRLSEGKLRQQQDNRKELLAGISHDLRSPLTSISAYADGLLDGIASTAEARERYLHMIKSKADEMIRLVSRLFLFSKMELDEYPLEPVSLRLDEELRDYVQAVAEDYADRGLEISVDATVPAPVRVDPEQLHTVLGNLLDNAAKYKTEPVGHAALTVEEEEGQILLRLQDDGPGVKEEELPRLFDVFYRSDPARQAPDRGSGLGLAIVSKAVQRMNGTVRAEPVLPHGLLITVTIPKENA